MMRLYLSDEIENLQFRYDFITVRDTSLPLLRGMVGDFAAAQKYMLHML